MLPPRADTWLFGYGSLVWRPAMPVVERRTVFVRGFIRRFWQGSPDHRGTPQLPGRVVTLLSAPRHEICWGVAYRLPVPALDDLLRQLDVREVAGYERRIVPAFQRGSPRPVLPRVLVYAAGPENPSYVGPAPLEQIAQRVRVARGASGDNIQYVRRLQRALRELGVHDPHVTALAGLLR
jgi:cation transport protein ChaC